MTLLEAVRDLNTFDEVDTIYAAKPWIADSPVIITRQPEEGGPPAEVAAMGLDRFLQVYVARDFLDEWTRELGAVPSNRDQVARLIRYAEEET